MNKFTTTLVLAALSLTALVGCDAKLGGDAEVPSGTHEVAVEYVREFYPQCPMDRINTAAVAAATQLTEEEMKTLLSVHRGTVKASDVDLKQLSPMVEKHDAVMPVLQDITRCQRVGQATAATQAGKPVTPAAPPATQPAAKA